VAYVVKRGARFTGYYRKGSKRLSAGTWGSESEAQYHALRMENGGSDSPSRANLTLSEYADKWLRTAELLPITKKGYESLWKRYLAPQIGSKRVLEVSTLEVRELLGELRAQGVGGATVAQIRACLGSLYKWLIEGQIAQTNPTRGIKVKVGKSDISNVVEPDEFKKIVNHLPTEGAKLFAKFLVASGARFGEATEIRLKDFNFNTKEVFIQRRVSELGKKRVKEVTHAQSDSRFLVVDATKSGYKRSVVLPEALIQEIKVFVRANRIGKEELVFEKSKVIPKGKIIDSCGKEDSSQPFVKNGKLFQHGTLRAYASGVCRCDECKAIVREYRRSQRAKSYQKGEVILDEPSHLPRDTWRTIWNKAIAKSGMGWSPRTHDLRHANATQLLKNGVDVHEVKERLGHQSIKTTERYLHRVRHQKSKASEIVNDFLG
jgi:site-specific recombinase XerD